MRYPTIIASLTLLAAPATVHAASCEPAFADGDLAVTINGVEIGPGELATDDFQLRVFNEAGSAGSSPDADETAVGLACAATIRVSRVGAGADPNLPSYDLRGPGSQQIEILPDPASGGTVSSDIVVANVPAGPQGVDVPFQLGVPTEWGIGAGTYIEQLELLLIDGSGNIADRSTLTITILIPPAASLRLVGAILGGDGPGPAQIDLGFLSSTAETRSQPFGARIFSTSPYIVSFNSANEGNLLHEQGREEIAYRLYFDGTLVDLAGTSEFPYLERAPKSGHERSMSIVVPPVAALAGRYSDRITVTVMAI